MFVLNYTFVVSDYVESADIVGAIDALYLALVLGKSQPAWLLYTVKQETGNLCWSEG